MIVAGRGESTLRNYSHHLAKLAVHFNCLPTTLDPDQVNDYLYLVKQQHKTPSDSYFKFTVYALRFAYRLKVELVVILIAGIHSEGSNGR